jgi:hypothetical protein
MATGMYAYLLMNYTDSILLTTYFSQLQLHLLRQGLPRRRRPPARPPSVPVQEHSHWLRAVRIHNRSL